MDPYDKKNHNFDDFFIKNVLKRGLKAISNGTILFKNMKYEIWFELFHILTTNRIKYILHDGRVKT